MFAGFGSQRAVKIKKIHYTCKLKFLKSAWYDRSLLRKLARKRERGGEPPTLKGGFLFQEVLFKKGTTKFTFFINKQSTTLC